MNNAHQTVVMSNYWFVQAKYLQVNHAVPFVKHTNRITNQVMSWEMYS